MNIKFKEKGYKLQDNDIPSPIMEVDSPGYEQMVFKNHRKSASYWDRPNFNKLVSLIKVFMTLLERNIHIFIEVIYN